MKIKKIQIHNFRCFEDYEISLASETVVIIGKNGTGKTTLISAIKKGMSFIFSNHTEKKMKPISNGNSDLKVASIGTLDIFYNNKTKTYADSVAITCHADLDSTCSLEWALKKRSTVSALNFTSYKDAYVHFLEYHQRTNKLPVYAFFSDSYPHVSSNLGSFAKSTLNSGRLPRNFGYYQWDAETSCAEIWQIRLLNALQEDYNYKSIINLAKQKLIGNEKEDERTKTDLTTYEELHQPIAEEINFITERLRHFSEPLDSLNANEGYQVSMLARAERHKSTYLEFWMRSGRKVLFHELPQGYKRLFSMVMDISYRAYCLNGSEEPEGFVLIDEIELHLHPGLAQEVLERFRKTFPNIQFIVSTHSPLVVTNLKYENNRNEVLKLTNTDGRYDYEKVENVYGIDYSDGLKDVMGIPPRRTVVDNLINSYIIQKIKRNDEKAETIYQEIFNMVGNDNTALKKEIEEKLNENL